MIIRRCSVPAAHGRGSWWIAILCVAMAVACGAAPHTPAGTEVADAAQTKPQDIDHLEPRRDSVGPRPLRFTWTAVSNVETYTLHVWNEVDVKVFEQSGLTQTALPWPDGLDLPFGTYFWAVTAQRAGKPIAESGLSAFVITE